MGTKKIYLCILCLFTAVIIVSCATVRHNDPSPYNLSLKNTLSVFLLNNERGSFFCIPVQYMGDYHIGKFDYTDGFILIGDYAISLKRDEINISVYLNEETDEDGSLDSGFNLVHSEENGRILLAKMDEPLIVKQVEDDGKFAHYYIFIERFLSDDEVRKINAEYERGNVHSRLEIWYDLVFDGEPQNGNGILDDFELYDGDVSGVVSLFPNLNFFKAKYL